MYQNCTRTYYTSMDSKPEMNTEKVDMYSESFNDILGEIDDIFCTPVYDIDYSFCVLCGMTKHKHPTTHKFICSKEQHRCIECGKFFFQHSHINSCYQPYYPVQIDER